MAAPLRHHFAVNVDDFEAVYSKVDELGFREDEGFFANVYELPDGAVQLHLRDPAGNLVEVNWPDVATLDRSIVTDVRTQPEPQSGDALYSTLYLAPREQDGGGWPGEPFGKPTRTPYIPATHGVHCIVARKGGGLKESQETADKQSDSESGTDGGRSKRSENKRQNSPSL